MAVVIRINLDSDYFEVSDHVLPTSQYVLLTVVLFFIRGGHTWARDLGYAIVCSQLLGSLYWLCSLLGGVWERTSTDLRVDISSAPAVVTATGVIVLLASRTSVEWFLERRGDGRAR